MRKKCLSARGPSVSKDALMQTTISRDRLGNTSMVTML